MMMMVHKVTQWHIYTVPFGPNHQDTLFEPFCCNHHHHYITAGSCKLHALRRASSTILHHKVRGCCWQTKMEEQLMAKTSVFIAHCSTVGGIRRTWQCKLLIVCPTKRSWVAREASASNKRFITRIASLLNGDPLLRPAYHQSDRIFLQFQRTEKKKQDCIQTQKMKNVLNW